MTKSSGKSKGIRLDKKFLERIIEKEEAEIVDGFKIIRDSLIYEGREHEDCEVIIKKGNDYFKFNYFRTMLGGRHLGKFRVKDKNDLGEQYFCKRVKPIERRMTIIDYE